jgi:hypothetical protein
MNISNWNRECAKSHSFWVSIPGFAHLIPEAVFKDKKVCIVPSYFKSRWRKRTRLSIQYPKPEISHWVRDLRIKIFVDQCEDVHDVRTRVSATAKNADLQLTFLRKLSSGEIGFDNLRFLRLTFGSNWVCGQALADHVDAFALRLLDLKPMIFRTKVLEVRVDCQLDRGYYFGIGPMPASKFGHYYASFFTKAVEGVEEGAEQRTFGEIIRA